MPLTTVRGAAVRNKTHYSHSLLRPKKVVLPIQGPLSHWWAVERAVHRAVERAIHGAVERAVRTHPGLGGRARSSRGLARGWGDLLIFTDF